ncbi:MAG: CzcE family metal-binding protein [Herminiimonas sp.]|nr:CzcE family metal-binding protein [Herminiimonas sp.]
MDKTILHATLACLCIALASGCAAVADTPARIALYGDPAPVTAATSTIVITPQTRYVNVTGGDITRFIVGDKAFAWSFNGSTTISSFDLRTTAPPGVLDHSVIAYIAPDPYKTGGDRGGHSGGGRHH